MFFILTFCSVALPLKSGNLVVMDRCQNKVSTQIVIFNLRPTELILRHLPLHTIVVGSSLRLGINVFVSAVLHG